MQELIQALEQTEWNFVVLESLITRLATDITYCFSAIQRGGNLLMASGHLDRVAGMPIQDTLRAMGYKIGTEPISEDAPPDELFDSIEEFLRKRKEGDQGIGE